MSILSLKTVTPDEVVSRISDVTPESLRKRGVDGLISDLDNTLVPWKSHEISDEVFAWLDAMKSAGIGVVLASNTIHPKRLKRIAERMGIPYAPGVRKPWPRGYRRSMEILGTTPANTAMLGDQIFTDIMGANALGIRTILLRPPLARREFLWTVFVRQIEKLLVAYLTRTGRWPERDAATTP